MILALFRMPYNSLTLFKYLYIGIDGSIFYLYYLYCLSIFQRTWRFVSKAGAKVSGLFLTAKLFSKFFFVFSFRSVSQALYAKGKEVPDKKIDKTAALANRTAKIRTFIFIFQTFSEVFLFLSFKRVRAL